MPEAGWAIRFYEANNYNEKATIDFASNYGEEARTLDSIIAFSGMYGIDSYLVWYIHKNIPSYDFSTVALNLRLTMYKNVEAIYFQEFYRVQDVRYDPNKSQYVLFAISEGAVRLHKKLISYDVKSLSYKEDRKAKDVIKDVIQENNIFHVVFHKDGDSTKNLPHYEYRYFDIDLEWTVLDFIQYICDENLYEWCIDRFIGEDGVPHFVLHIGHELKPFNYRNATKKFEREIDNVSTSIYGFKIATSPSPMDVLAHWEESHKCAWAKHTAGKGGGISKGYFVPLGQGHLDKEIYLRSLEGSIEKDIGYSLLKRQKKRLYSVTIGNILKDESVETDEFGNPIKMLPYIDEVSIQKNPDTYTIREPHNIIINRGDDLAVQHQLEKATRSTPYLDHESGLLFPSPKLLDGEDKISPPNSLIFNIDGKRESAVIGGYVYGNGREDYKIPFKRKADFRLKFPDKSELSYNSLEGFWALESPHGFVFKNSIVTKYDEMPAQRRVEGDNTVVVLKDDMFWIEGPTQLFQLEPAGCFHLIPTTDEVGNVGEGRYEMHAWNDLGRIDFYADNKINIKTSKIDSVIDIEIGPDGSYAGTVNIRTGGTVNIIGNATININTETGGTVNIGASSDHVNLAGGAKALAHANHVHTMGNMGIPVNPCADNTTKTKAD